MKKLFYVLTFFVYSLSANAQKNTVFFSGGKTFFGTWDMDGFNIVVGHERNLKKWLGFKTQLNLASGSLIADISESNLLGDYPYKFYTYSNQALKLQTGFSFKFINSKKHTLGLDVLGLLAHYTIISNTGIILNPDENAPKEWRYFRLPPQYEKVNKFGGMAQLGYRYKFNHKYGLGLDYNLQVYNGNGERNLNLVFQHLF